MKYRLLFAAVLTLLLLLGTDPGQAQTPLPGMVQVEVVQVDNSVYPQVTVYVRVTDAYGDRVNDLTKDNFMITEGGTKVEIIGFSGINPEPIRTVLVLDKSGSMDYENKLTSAKEAALTFIDLMRPQDHAAFIVFDNAVDLLQDFTSDKDTLKAQISAVTIGDCTSWYEAIYFAAGLTIELSGRKGIILLSDGMDCRENWILHELFGYGSPHSFEEAVAQAQKAETPVITIALGREPAASVGNEGYDEERLTRMASQTSGQYYHTPTADQLSELYRSLSRAMQEEYVLTYRSPRPTYDGTRRDIRVTVVAAGSNTEGEGASGGATYLEEHLVTIQSDWRIAAICIGPLVLAALIPLTVSALLSAKKQPPSDLSSVVVGSACANCGQKLRSGARFCPRCGKKVS